MKILRKVINAFAWIINFPYGIYGKSKIRKVQK